MMISQLNNQRAFEELDLPTSPELVQVWADGACLGNPGPGGWGYVKTFDGVGVRRSGWVAGQTTNVQMEMVAVLQAILGLKRKEVAAVIYTDSQLVVRGMNEWRKGWLTRGWRSAQGALIQNRDIWEALIEAEAAHTGGITFVWVKGHAGDPGNEEADRLAGLAAWKAMNAAGPGDLRATRFDPTTGLVVPISYGARRAA